MSYELPRPAKLLKPLTGKVIGKQEFKDYKVGKRVMVQRNPSNPGVFVIFFTKKIVTQIPSMELPETIEYLD